MIDTTFGPRRLRAIIFDLDGTLYRQDPVRKEMLWRLVRGHALRPLSGLRTMRVLSAYRRAQEVLRTSALSAPPSADLAAAQIQLTCERTGATRHFVEGCVARWMEQEPLAIVTRNIQPGLLTFVRACKARGLRLGVLSDYPAHAKLQALGLDGFFDVVLAAQSPEVGVFKPHPRGLLVVAEQLRVSPSECAFVGDRAAVDGRAAAAAGMACFILTRSNELRGSRSWTNVSGFVELHGLLAARRDDQPHLVAPQPRLNGG
jgi:HAD superfamily hydrolase (TIGR01509 family)